MQIRYIIFPSLLNMKWTYRVFKSSWIPGLTPILACCSLLCSAYCCSHLLLYNSRCYKPIKSTVNEYWHQPCVIPALTSAVRHPCTDIGRASSQHWHRPCVIPALTSPVRHPCTDIGRKSSLHWHRPYVIPVLTKAIRHPAHPSVY